MRTKPVELAGQVEALVGLVSAETLSGGFALMRSDSESLTAGGFLLIEAAFVFWLLEPILKMSNCLTVAKVEIAQIDFDSVLVGQFDWRHICRSWNSETVERSYLPDDYRPVCCSSGSDPAVPRSYGNRSI